jgi:membrane protein required for colicin V production
VSLNWLDFVIIILVGLSVVEGVTKGFARTGIGLAASILGVILGIWFYGTVAYYILPHVTSPGVANFIGFMVVFLTCLTAGAVLGSILAALLEKAGLTFFDRVLGAALGVIRGGVTAIVLVMILVAFTPNPPSRSVEQSRWAPYLIGSANVLAEFAPRELKDSFFESYDKVKEEWNKHVPKKKMRLPETEI